MSQAPRDRYDSESHLEHLVDTALREMGEAIPTTEEEVARMEAELGALPEAPPRKEPHRAARKPEVASELPASEPPASELPASELPASELPASELPASELPASEPPASETAHSQSSLMQPQAPPSGLAPRRSGRRRTWFAHFGSAAMGAIAASFLWLWLRPSPPAPIVLAPGGGHPASGVPPETRVTPPEKRLSLSVRCDDCCAGKACAAKPTACPSGRQCVPCALEGQARFRLRIGSVHGAGSSGEGRSLGEGLELCVAVAQGKASCVPASHYTQESEPWRVLAPVVSAQDLLAGVAFELKSPESQTPVATWRRPVAAGAEILCRGLSIPLAAENGERMASVSAFLDDAQFVEFGRAATPGLLLESAEALSSETVRAQVHETSATGDRHFALVVGPLSVEAANRVRWQLLDRGYSASFTTGSDLLPPARPPATP